MRSNSVPTPSPVRAVYGRPDALKWRFRRFLEVFRGLNARTSANARNFFGRYQRLHRQGPPHGQTRMFGDRIDDTLEATKHGSSTRKHAELFKEKTIEIQYYI